MSEITQHRDDRKALAAIKQRIQASQTRAVLAVNAEQLGLYWDSGPHLTLWQPEREWGSAVVKQMASETCLYAMRQIFAFFAPHFEFVPQAVGQLPWVFLLSDSHSKPTPQWSSLL
jgi:hypothetical protein